MTNNKLIFKTCLKCDFRQNCTLKTDKCNIISKAVRTTIKARLKRIKNE